MHTQTAVLINQSACAGRALQRWGQIVSKLPHWIQSAEIKFVDDSNHVEETTQWVRDCVSRETKLFIAVGGDGTVNTLLNALCVACDELGVATQNITLGAIGLGSSNDFHKPFTATINGFPLKIDYSQTQLADVLCGKNLTTQQKKYFLINASVGVTAQANYFFNNPDYVLKKFRAFNTHIAIAYTALHTIFSYSPVTVECAIDEYPITTLKINNMGMVKNKYFSGSLKYPLGAAGNSGNFVLYVCHSMRLGQSLRTLLGLAFGRLKQGPKVFSRAVKKIALSSDQAFAVEMDGEVVSGTNFEIGVSGKQIRVCL